MASRTVSALVSVAVLISLLGVSPQQSSLVQVAALAPESPASHLAPKDLDRVGLYTADLDQAPAYVSSRLGSARGAPVADLVQDYAIQPYSSWAPGNKRQKSPLTRAIIAPFHKAMSEALRLSRIPQRASFTFHSAFSPSLQSNSPPGLFLLV